MPCHKHKLLSWPASIHLCLTILHPPSLCHLPATRVAKQEAQAGQLQSKQNGLSGMQGGIPPCVPDSHPYRVTSTKCLIDTVISPDDGHIVAQNMYRKEINIPRKTVHQVGFNYKIIQGRTVNRTWKKCWSPLSIPGCTRQTKNQSTTFRQHCLLPAQWRFFPVLVSKVRYKCKYILFCSASDCFP